MKIPVCEGGVMFPDVPGGKMMKYTLRNCVSKGCAAARSNVIPIQEHTLLCKRRGYPHTEICDIFRCFFIQHQCEQKAPSTTAAPH